MLLSLKALVCNTNSINHTRTSQSFINANETFWSRASRVKYCYYYFPEVQFCLALKYHPFGFCDTATLTHIPCFYWSLSFLVNLKISKARMQLTASQGKSALRTFCFKIKITFCFPKHIIYKQLRKMQDINWCHMVTGGNLSVWSWRETFTWMMLSAEHSIDRTEKWGVLLKGHWCIEHLFSLNIINFVQKKVAVHDLTIKSYLQHTEWPVNLMTVV